MWDVLWVRESDPSNKLIQCISRQKWRAEADEKENCTYAIALHND